MKKSKNKRKIFLNFLLVGVILLSIFIFSGCGRVKISVISAKLLDVQIGGCNGHGTAVLSLNTENLKNELAKYKDNEHYAEINKLLNGMKFEFADKQQDGKLKNNEEFDVVALYDKYLAERANVVMEDTTLTCTAKNLSDGEELDAFKNLKVKFSGENGKGKAKLDTGNCSEVVKNCVKFKIESSDKYLWNGSTITVSATEIDDKLKKKGYFLKEETKKYTVEKLAGPRTSLDGVDTESLREEMDREMNYHIQNDYYVFDCDYTFASGKKRDLSSFECTYDTSYTLEKYQYIYSRKDVSNNSLIAYYRVTTNFVSKEDQMNVSKGAAAMKKGEKDKGVTYVAISTNPLKMDSNNQLDKNNYIFFNSASGKTIPEIQKQLGITSYTSEYFDKDFNIIAYAEPETEPPTQAPTKKSAENKQVQQ